MSTYFHNKYFPDYVNMDNFEKDYHDKSISASMIQRKYHISPRQYRMLVRHLTSKSLVSLKSCQEQYIYVTKGAKFSIRKRIDGVYKYFYTCETLDDAINVRDKLVSVGWDEKKLYGLK